MRKLALIALLLLFVIPFSVNALAVCPAGYDKQLNITFNTVRAGDVIDVNLSNIANLSAKGAEMQCYNSDGAPIAYQTVVNGIWYQNGAAVGHNTSASWQKDNYTVIYNNGSLTSTASCYFLNTTAKTDLSTSLALWYDNFKSYSLGTLAARSNSSSAFGRVCLSHNGQKAGGCNLTGGNSLEFNVTQYGNITVVWEVDSSSSNANDIRMDIMGKDAYRTPQSLFANDYRIFFGASIGAAVNYTGVFAIPYNITSERNGSQLLFKINHNIVGGNVTDTTIMTHSVISWAPSVTLKALLSLKVWNLSINDYATPATYTTAVANCNDNIAPVVNITQPTGLKTSGNVSLIYTATDDVAISSCQYRIDNGSNVTLGSCQNTTFNSTEGYHNVTVCANDTSGNIACAVSAYAVDSISPLVIITSPANATLSGATANVSLIYTVSNGVAGINSSTCVYSLDGAANISLPSCQNSTLNVTVPATHTVKIYVYDNAGNAGSSADVFVLTAFVPPAPPPSTSQTILGLFSVIISLGMMFFGVRLALNSKGDGSLLWSGAMIFIIGIVLLIVLTALIG